MDASTILLDGFGRVSEEFPAIVDGLSVEQLLWRPDAGSNSIGWLLWHIGRMEDAQMAGLGGLPPVWMSGGWKDRFGLPYRDSDVGYGQSADDVAAFTLTDPGLLVGYYQAVGAQTAQVVAQEQDWDRVVDENWDPPVTAAVRVVSVVNDATQHLGQAAYLKGLVQRREGTG